MSTEKNYGCWSSKISLNNIQNNAIVYQYLCQDELNGETVFWVEMWSHDNGRNVIVSRNINSSENVIWTPKEYSVQTKVHEYGGADCFINSQILYFSNALDQHLYKQIRPKAEPVKVSQGDRCRYANGSYSGSLESIFIVREDHSVESHVVNSIATIRQGHETVLVQGADFYSSPRVSPDGSKLCWIEWNHPNMPWDNTRVCVANLNVSNGSIVLLGRHTVTTGSDSVPISCTLSQWTVSGDLCFISDQSGFWNLWITAGTDIDRVKNLTPVDEDLGDPMWHFDYRRYNYLPIRDEFVVARKGGRLEFFLPDGCQREIVDFSEHLSFLSHCQLMRDGSVVALGYSRSTRKTIYRLWRDGTSAVLGQSGIVDDVDQHCLSVPRHIQYMVSGGCAYGYFYGPCNPLYRGPKGTLPPLLVQVHGGPTAAVFTDLDMEIQYWTSRGYAVLDVDYRGSTGYGKQYRHSLRGQWGVYDTEDCCQGAKFLIEEGLVDPEKVVIRGGSAGGYTTLCCLIFKSLFKAGSSSYGIGNLRALAKNGHKFESHYFELLIGDLDKQSHLYYERSPIHFPEKITTPIIFFQGDEDPVVPKEQSEQMFDIVKRQGVPCSLVMYRGEGHGFRKMDNIIHNVESEYYFFAKILGLETPDIVDPPIVIENYHS